MIRLLVLLLLPLGLFAQQAPTLDECYTLARANYPKLKQAELIQQMSNLRMENISTDYYPTVGVKGQATYQSDVTSLNLNIPNLPISIEKMAKDQYKIYLDVRQNIWDGGTSSAQKGFEKAKTETEIQQLEIELNQLKTLVNNWYFAILEIDQSLLALTAKKEILAERIKQLNSGKANGVILANDVDNLIAEQLITDQQLQTLASKRKTAITTLSLLIGQSLDEKTMLQTPITIMNNSVGKRPELQYFEYQKTQLAAGEKLLQTRRNPRFIAFGQAGYGRPALNMLDPNFSTYYTVGVGLSWNILDWKTTSREKKILQTQSEYVSTMMSDFDQKQRIQISQSVEQIKQLEKLIETDKAVTEIRERIALRTSSSLENGTITSSDYIVDLNNVTLAKITEATHKVQLNQAVSMYNLITGKE